jgi:hypothetical protein
MFRLRSNFARVIALAMLFLASLLAMADCSVAQEQPRRALGAPGLHLGYSGGSRHLLSGWPETILTKLALRFAAEDRAAARLWS